MEKIEEKPWKKYPMTRAEAVQEVLLHLLDDTKKELANTSKGGLTKLHHGLGTYIRNGLGLWKYYTKNPKAAIGETTDGESWILIKDAWEYLQTHGNYKDILRDPRTGEQLPD
jgi:hypothetical protein